MVDIRTLEIDLDFLKTMYQIDPITLDEMALPSLFHSNPLVRWITSTRLKKALSLIELKPDCNLMDFGCGPGILLTQIPPNSGKLFGVDIVLWPAEKVINQCGRKDINLFNANNWVSNISNQSLDYIVATEVLEHIKDIEPILSDFRAKLKPGGKLIVSLPTENIVYKMCRIIAGFSGDYHQESIVDIEKVCKQSHFTLEKKYSLPAPSIFCLYKLYLFSK